MQQVLVLILIMFLIVIAIMFLIVDLHVICNSDVHKSTR